MRASIQKHISEHISLTSKEQSYFFSLLKPVELQKKDILISPGDRVDDQYFVVKGCLKAFEIDAQGDEHIIQFAIEDWWISDFKAYYNKIPASLYIDCVEDVELLKISKEDLENLFNKVPKFNRFFRIKLTNAFLSMQDRILSALDKNSAERYLDFLATYPNIEQRVPNYQIANYLGIKPESLSRLRRKLTKEIS
ncbi:Crp/Fnr family transcriptional regulator [Galbibacter sp. BG1]|uniref:Crp/Fnr family transcriptional regulator n=1 Tax=Galbibacter sp. BG1 TaxID=1170699 RepID=UPI0015C184FA|nr:Crp/Fnr family transcriptional regulator [Galbibacter sp. BG1]QLE01697.1 Crp/Fnr family transcriptional regulator [Galbibacter sp. BG1]